MFVVHCALVAALFAVRGGSSGMGELARGHDKWARSLVRPDDASGTCRCVAESQIVANERWNGPTLDVPNLRPTQHRTMDLNAATR